MENEITKLGANIVAGGGYSSDSQQTTNQECFNAVADSVTGAQSYAQLNEAMSFSDIQKQLKVDVSAKGGFDMFSASAEASYLRSMENKDYSMSLNYFVQAQGSVSVQIAGNGMDALTNVGKSFYQNGTNPYFGLVCGNNYIDSYEEGAMLTMGINIDFQSHMEKSTFEAHAGASFGDIFSASGSIQKICSEYNLQGSVVMQAFQKGGDPSKLSNILGKDSSGNYYATTCNLKDLTSCTKAASSMLDYAKNDFSNQFSFVNNTGLTPLGVGFMSYEPIEYVGLIPPKLLVNETVLEDRLTLANNLVENQYYVQKFHELLNGYPVALDITSTLYKESQSLLQQAQNNVNAIMSPSNPQVGALGCFDFPDSCIEISNNVLSEIQPIKTDDLSILDSVEKYYSEFLADFYYDGTIWKNLNHDVIDQIIKVYSATFQFDPVFNLLVSVDTEASGSPDYGWKFYNATLHSDNKTITTDCYTNWPAGCYGTQSDWTVFHMLDNPFYFEAYNSSDSGLAGEAAGLLEVA